MSWIYTYVDYILAYTHLMSLFIYTYTYVDYILAYTHHVLFIYTYIHMLTIY